MRSSHSRQSQGANAACQKCYAVARSSSPSPPVGIICMHVWFTTISCSFPVRSECHHRYYCDADDYHRRYVAPPEHERAAWAAPWDVACVARTTLPFSFGGEKDCIRHPSRRTAAMVSSAHTSSLLLHRAPKIQWALRCGLKRQNLQTTCFTAGSSK